MKNLKSKGYLTDNAYEYIQSLISSVKVENVGLDNEKLSWNTTTDINLAQDSDNTNHWVLDYDVDIYKNDAGKYTVSLPNPNGQIYEEESDGTQTLIGTYEFITGSSTTEYESLEDAIQDLKYTEEEENNNNNLKSVGMFNYNNGNVQLESTSIYDTNELRKNLISSIFEAILDCYINQDGAIHDSKFLEDMLLDSNYNKTETKSGETISEIKTDYNKALDALINFIDAKKSTTINNLKTLLDNGDITAKDLKDEERILELIKAGQTDIEMTSEFQTVIKDYIVKNMIANTGEPKYAWVDENDTGNTGNADAKAQWYTNLFNRMKEGYKTLENGLASSKEWMEYALETGIVTIEQVDKTYTWKNIDYKTCSKITEQTDNSAAVAKPEAEYNRAMNDINAKDKLYDIELKNIDTVHSALQTEYESIKNVMNKNIVRVFKFNQNG